MPRSVEAPGAHKKSPRREIKALYLRPSQTRRQTVLNETIILEGVNRQTAPEILFIPTGTRRN